MVLYICNQREREKNMTNEKVYGSHHETVFIDAEEGARVGVYIGAGNQVGAASTPSMLAYILDTHKIFGEVMFCSTMDFATEVGFPTDSGAKELFDAAVAMRS
jgi:hypothetical protein